MFNNTSLKIVDKSSEKLVCLLRHVNVFLIRKSPEICAFYWEPPRSVVDYGARSSCIGIYGKMEMHLTLEDFAKCIDNLVKISDALMDGWISNEKQGVENGKYIVKRHTTTLKKSNDEVSKVFVAFEYHIAYQLSYGVPIICFKVWKQDGSLLSLEEYWELNEGLREHNMYDTLTQLDHPVLCQPFLTLHPCRTQEIIQPFLENSKNPVISWLSVVGPFVHLSLLEEYLKNC